MRIAVIGTGYVGLVAGTCLADSGNDVTCVDVDEAKIAQLRAGDVPIYEPGLQELIERGVREQRLSFSSQLEPAVGRADVVFIAVGTPGNGSGEADISAVLAVGREVGRALRGPCVIVCKSTVPVGTNHRLREAIGSAARHPFDVVSNPEFLREGCAILDFTRPDRVVIGADSQRARDMMGQLYAPFTEPERPLFFMDPRSAEISKYAANALLATRISFMNEMAALCEKVGADIEEVRRAVGADRRIGLSFLQAGAGYGGSCFPKDVKALVAMGRAHGVPFALAQTVEDVNERQKRLLVTRVSEHFAGLGGVAGRRIALWGLAFKPQTDDLREAPSLAVIDGLARLGADIAAYDPVAMPAARRLIGDAGGRLRYAQSGYDALDGADALVVVTDWNEFRQPDWGRVAALLKHKVLLDGRNLYDGKALRALGFTYSGIGRPLADPGALGRAMEAKG